MRSRLSNTEIMKQQGVVMLRLCIFWGILVLLVREAILSGWFDRLIM